MVINTRTLTSLLRSSAVYKRVKEFIEPLPPQTSEKSKIAVAVSGGPDSLLLCILLKIFCVEAGWDLTALHVNHKLRPEADTEQEWLKTTLKSWQIDVEVFEWTHAAITAGIQQKARDARLCLMTGYCQSQAIPYLFFGHQLDDQIETVLMRFFHGSGLKGLRGIQAETLFNNVRLLRPFLIFEKREIVALLEKLQHPFLMDPSNESAVFLRVKWRKALQETLSSQDKKHALTALKKIQASEAALSFYVERIFLDFVTLSPLGYARLDREFFQQSLPEEIKLRVIEKLIASLFIKPPFIRRERLERCLAKLKSDVFSSMTFGGCALTKIKDHLLVSREIAAIQPDYFLNQIERREWDNRYFIDKILIDESGNAKIGNLTREDLKWLKSKMVDIPLLSNKVLLTLPVVKTEKEILSVPHLSYNAHLSQMTFVGLQREVK